MEGVLPALLGEKFVFLRTRGWGFSSVPSSKGKKKREDGGVREGISQCGPGQFRILGLPASAPSAGIIGVNLQTRSEHILKGRIRVFPRFRSAGCSKLNCMHALGNKG